MKLDTVDGGFCTERLYNVHKQETNKRKPKYGSEEMLSSCKHLFLLNKPHCCQKDRLLLKNTYNKEHY